METVQKTNKVRLQKWAQIMKERKASGLGVKEWCNQTGINRNQYFYWQRKLRNTLYGEAKNPYTTVQPSNLAVSGFTEVRLLENKPIRRINENVETGTLQIAIGDIQITADSDYPPQNLTLLLRGLTVC